MSKRNKAVSKVVRRDTRMANKRVADFSFSDIGAQELLIKKYHQAHLSMNEYFKEKFQITRPIWDLNDALASLKMRVERFLGVNAKYSPHQGKQEVARRQRQIKAGLLRVSAI